MVSYATNSDVAAYLNRSLTSPQQTQADFYIAAASAWIDQHTGRSWSVSSPATEKQTIISPFIYLKNKPVLSITSVTVRALYPGADDIVLTSGTQFELLDSGRGLVSLDTGLVVGGPWISKEVWTPYYGYLATIVYTHSFGVPDNIKLAAIIMAAQKMTMSLNPMSQRLKSFSDNRAVSVTFKDDEVPADAISLLPPKQVFIV